MAEDSKIEWTDHTFNAWLGCQKVSPACDHCYAETWANRYGMSELWNGERRRTSENTWRAPIKWNRKAAALGIRYRVFCSSLSDVFDNQVSEHWRADLWALIASTPHLDWQLLTKRPQNIAKMLPGSYVEQLLMQDMPWGPRGWPNVWLGTTVENQAEADRRIPHLLSVPTRVHFLSCEPLLGHVVLPIEFLDSDFSEIGCASSRWVITGGESGVGARPSHPDRFRDLRDQCAAAGVAFFMKQMGGRQKPFPPIPDDLMIRQYPRI